MIQCCRNREHKKRMGRVILHLSRTRGEATATVAAASEREEGDVMVLLLFIWVTSYDTSFIAPDIYNTDSNIITHGGYTVNPLLSFHRTYQNH